ncbi:hypothetical protein BTO30_08730 [Domibacillus antri]|uniref:DUF3139 domain-containing protein n=1 Tax=Domibacillus antri TaxID=1714264 RepID=A0A1Q8Q5E3_9BACI|nr:hypothetical protein [Domibacillus antri]OLN22564.1 hypothetical protein BTO30_08730 [Domibacillus antri]
MYPATLITCFLFLVPIALVLLIALLMKKRRTGLLLAAVCIGAGEVIYLMNDRDADRVEGYENLDAVDEHLRALYPDEKWVSYNAVGAMYEVEVVFYNEPGVMYGYVVDDERVYQSGGGYEEGVDPEWLHYEEETR